MAKMTNAQMRREPELAIERVNTLIEQFQQESSGMSFAEWVRIPILPDHDLTPLKLWKRGTPDLCNLFLDPEAEVARALPDWDLNNQLTGQLAALRKRPNSTEEPA